MEEDPYHDDGYNGASHDPASQSNVPSEAELRVQKMLGHQLDTEVSLEKQAAQNRSFTPASTTYRPFVEQASGQLSLADFQVLEREHQVLEELRACGLTDQEIALKLEQEGRQMSSLVPPRKRAGFAADPVARRKRLKVVEEKIARKRASLGEPSHEASPDLPRHDEAETPVSDDMNRGDVPGPFKDHTTLGHKYVHPDDPINHLDAIAERLFGKSVEDKQSGNVSQRRGNTPSSTETASWEHSLRCHDDSCHGAEKRRRHPPNEDSAKVEDEAASEEGFRAGCTLAVTEDRQEFVTKAAREADPHTSQLRNLSNTPHGGPYLAVAGTAVEDNLADTDGVLGIGQETQQVPGAEEECSGVPSGNESLPHRRLPGLVRPLSREDLLQQRLSQDDIHKMERFRNNSPGQPSKVLYLKNLSNQVTEADLASAFVSFQSPNRPKIIFKLLTGRMRGQAFVTFADEETAAEAMHHVHGYPLRGKPVIIQYGRHTR